MPFFTYMQNNSGGHYIVNDQLAHCVVIEARNCEQANESAQELGIYFDDGERDCPTCGSRWDECYDNGADKPEIYGKGVTEALLDKDSYLYHVQGIVHVYYMNGNHGVFTTQSFTVTHEPEAEELPELGDWFSAVMKLSATATRALK